MSASRPHSPRSYGDVIAHSLGIGAPPALRTERLLSSRIAVSRLTVGRAQLGLSPRVPAEDTFILAHYLTDVPHHELLSRGRPRIAQGYEAGSMRIVNLMDEFSARITHTHQSVAYYIPRDALNEAAEQAGLKRIADLSCDPGAVDPVIRHLSAALLPALANPAESSSLFVDHVVGALVDHLMRRYGGAGESVGLIKGGLSPYQLGRAKEALAAEMERDVTLAEVADICGLSRGHFAKAFRLAAGTTPHRWRQQCRIDQAKRMLVRGEQSIAEIALICGFADQSHFTRVFSRMVGETPAGWRRRMGG
jgi:AraC family transcriptional regulator